MKNFEKSTLYVSFFQKFAYPLDGVHQKQKQQFFNKVMIWLENSKSVYALPLLCHQASCAGHFGLWHSSIRFQFSLLLLSALTPTYVCKSEGNFS